MISVKTFIRKSNGSGALLDLDKNNIGSSKWDTIVEKAESIIFNQVRNIRNLCYPLPKNTNINY